MSLSKKITARVVTFFTVSLLSPYAISYNETDLFNDIPEVSSVSRLPQNLKELPVSTTVITQEMIRASAATEITELLRLVPGFQTYYPNANKAAVTYHGNSGEFPNRLDIRINGRPVYSALLSTVAWSTLGVSLEDVHYIEVVRGSNVPSYGSNALLGAINIVTFQPLDQHEQYITTTVGSQDTKRINSSFVSNTDNLNFRVSLTHDENSGFDLPQDGKEVDTGNISLTITPTLFDTINVTAGFNDGHTDIGSGNTNNPLSYLPRDHLSHYQQIDWSHTLNDGSEIKLNIFNDYLKLSTPKLLASQILSDPGLTRTNNHLQQLADAWPFLFTDVWGPTYPFNTTTVSDFYTWPKGEDGVAQTFGAEIQFSNQLASTLDMASGFGYRQDRVTSEALLGQTAAIDEDLFYLFSNAEWKATDRLNINAGMMIERSTLAPIESSFRLGSNYQVTENFMLRTAATKAYRIPSLLEEMRETSYVFPEGVVFDYAFQANNDLKAEQLVSAEAGFVWDLPQYNGYIDFKLFQETISDGMSSWFTQSEFDLKSVDLYMGDLAKHAANPDYVVRYYDELGVTKNTSKSRARGFDLQATFQPHHKDLFHLAYSYNELHGMIERGAKKDLELFNRTPRHTLALLYNHKLTSELDASIIYNYMSDVRWLDTNLIYGYQTFDTQISHRTQLAPGHKLTTKLIIKNLLNEQYNDFDPNNAFERRLFLTMQMSF